MRYFRSVLMSLLCLVVLAPCAMADDYPNRPVQMVVGFRAGGAADTMARVLAKELGDIMGQPFVVMNKPGGGGAVAAAYMANVDPDGYTVSVGIDATFSFTPIASENPQYVMDDFQFLGILGQFQTGYVTYADSPYNSFKEIIDAAKAGKTFRYGSMTPDEKIPMLSYCKKHGLKLMPVPTKGGSAIMTAILGKHVDFGYSGGIHYSYVKAGKMKLLAAGGTERLEDFPDVPTMQEQGIDMDNSMKFVGMAPAKTPKAIVAKLEEAFKNAAESEEYKDLLTNKLHVKYEYGDSAQAMKYLQHRRETYKEALSGN